MIASGLARLFPDDAVAFETNAAGDPSGLYPAEFEAIARAVPVRAQEFAAGRACARRALAALGVKPVALPVRADRRPAWPAGIRGSISHTPGLCVAVAAPASRLASVGIDVERLGRLREDLWHLIFTAGERAVLRSRPRDARGRDATLIFSAKEAFFKCQFELTSTWLEFADVEIEFDHRAFRAVPRNAREFDTRAYHGRFEHRPPFVCTGCYVETAGVR